MDPEHKFETSSYLCYKISHLIPISFKICLLGWGRLPYSPHPLCLWRPWCIPKVSWTPTKTEEKLGFSHQTSPGNNVTVLLAKRLPNPLNPRQTTFEMDPWICVSCESVAGKICGDIWYMQLQGSPFSCSFHPAQPSICILSPFPTCAMPLWGYWTGLKENQWIMILPFAMSD